MNNDLIIQTQTDQINLYDLLFYLIRKSYIILISFIIFTSVAFYINSQKPDLYEGSVTYRMINDDKVSDFLNINRKFKPYEFVVDKDKLKETFISEFLSYRIAKDTIISLIENQSYNEIFDPTLATLENKRLNKIATNYARKFRLEQSERMFVQDKIVFMSVNKENDTKILSEIIDQLNNTIINNIKKEAISIVNDLIYQDNVKLKAIEVEQAVLKKKHVLDQNSILGLLQEQASIARALGLEGSSLSGLEYGKLNNSSIDIKIDSDQPDYLRGYRAIEEEILRVKDRIDMDPLLFDPNLRSLELDKIRIMSTIDKADFYEIIKQLQNTKNFQAVDMNLDTIDFVKNNSKLKNLLIFMFFGLLLPIVALIIFKGYKEFSDAKN